MANSGGPSEQFRLAELLIRLKRYDEAEALVAQTEEADAAQLRGQLAAARGDVSGMRIWFEKALALAARDEYRTWRGRLAYARALTTAGDFHRADEIYATALAPGREREPSRPGPGQRELMSKRAPVLERLGRREDAEFYRLPVQIASAAEDRKWDEAKRLADRMLALAPRVRSDPNAVQMAHEFRSAVRNDARGNAPPPYEAPRALQLCGPWTLPEPPASTSPAMQTVEISPATSGPPQKEAFDFAWFPVRPSDPDAALFRSLDRFVSYAGSCERTQDTIRVLEGARKLFAENGYATKNYSELLIALGKAHARAGNFDGADSAYTEVANLIAGGEPLAQYFSLTATLSDVARFYNSFGRYDRAELHVTRMIAGLKGQADQEALDRIRRLMLLEIYLLQGDADKALAALERTDPPPLPSDPDWERAAAAAPRVRDKPEINLIAYWTYNEGWYGKTLLLLGQNEEAVEVLQRAKSYAERYFEVLKQEGGTVFPFDPPRTLSGIYEPLAAALRAVGREEEAFEAYRLHVESLELRDEEEALVALPEFARVAEVSIALGDLVYAKKALGEVRRIVPLLANSTDEADTSHWAASMALGIVDPAERSTALTDGQKLFERLERQWEVGSRSALDTEWQKRQLRSAGRLYANHASLLWTVSGNGSDAVRREQAFRSVQRAVLDTADLSIANAAARALLGRSKPEMVAVVEQRDELVRRYLAATSGQFESAAASAEQLDALAKQLGELDARIRRDAPDYFNLIRSDPLSPAEASALMEPDEATLLIVPGEFGTQIMAVTREGVSWRSSALKQQEVADRVRRLLYFAGSNVTASDEEKARWQREVDGGFNGFDRDTAFALHKELIEPLLPAIQGKQHLYVAGTGALSSLPFAMLVSQAPAGRDDSPADLRATRWFGDDFTLVQIPSLQALALFKRQAAARAAGGGGGFAGFGHPVLGDDQARGTRGPARQAGPVIANAYRRRGTRSGEPLIADVSELRKLASLPGTAQELNALAGEFGAPAGSLRLQGQATEAALKSADLSGTRVLALATHGLTAGEVPGVAEPGLVFTPPPIQEEANQRDDGLLTASEIALLRLDADWVILSACNTAAGDGSRGAPGLSGLARAFFYAGARNLLASHWPVRDDVAARITVLTIQKAKENPRLTRAQAYQLAVQEIRKETKGDGVMRGGFDSTWAHPNA